MDAVHEHISKKTGRSYQVCKLMTADGLGDLDITVYMDFPTDDEYKQAETSGDAELPWGPDVKMTGWHFGEYSQEAADQWGDCLLDREEV